MSTGPDWGNIDFRLPAQDAHGVWIGDIPVATLAAIVGQNLPQPDPMMQVAVPILHGDVESQVFHFPVRPMGLVGRSGFFANDIRGLGGCQRADAGHLVSIAECTAAFDNAPTRGTCTLSVWYVQVKSMVSGEVLAVGISPDPAIDAMASNLQLAGLEDLDPEFIHQGGADLSYNAGAQSIDTTNGGVFMVTHVIGFAPSIDFGK